jgi:hypothetical protein
MKIYKYYDWIVPKCVNLWIGYYLNTKTRGVIGFGDDTTVADSNAKELTEQEYYDWVMSVGEDTKEAQNLLQKLSSLSTKNYEGQKVQSISEVIAMTVEKTNKLFSDPSGFLDTNSYQLKLLSQMVSLLYAYIGVVKYDDIGIAGITDKTSADKFVTTQMLPLWLQNNVINSNADQFIKDNNLK